MVRCVGFTEAVRALQLDRLAVRSKYLGGVVWTNFSSKNRLSRLLQQVEGLHRLSDWLAQSMRLRERY